MCLNPFIIDRAADRRHMHADNVRDLFHLQRFEKFRTVVEKIFLVIDDRLCHPRQRAASLFDRLDQPLGRRNFLLDKFLFFWRRLAVGDPLAIVVADIQITSRAFFHLHDVFSVVVGLQPHIRCYRRNEILDETAGRFRIEIAAVLPRLR